MNRISNQAPRLSGGPAPNHRPAAHLEESPQPLAGHGEGAADMVRQFQQVMMRFLQTQETVMHDLVVFMGSRGAAAPYSSPALAVESNGDRGVGYAPSPTRAPYSPPSAPATAGIAADPPPRRSAAENGTSNGHRATDATSPAPKLANGAAPPAPAREVAPVAHPEAAAVGAPDRQQLTEQLLAIVAERTGYPEEMLTLDIDLEADLGIDSIKRVEIAGTMIRGLNLPAGSTPDLEKLTGSRTIRQVLDNLEAILQPTGSPPPEAVGAAAPGAQTPPFDDARTGPGVGRFALKLAPAPARSDPAGLATDGVVVLIDDGSGMGKRLAGRLEERGHRVVTVGSGPGGQADDPSRLVADLGSPEGVARLVEEIRWHHGRASALIHLAALRPGSDEVGLDPARWRDRQGADLTSLFLLAQALQVDLEAAAAEGGAAVLAATSLGGGFGIDRAGNSGFPGQGGIAGFLKTLAREWPTVRVKAVDVSPGSPEAVSGWLMDEVMAADGLVEVGYRDGTRTRIELVPRPLDDGSMDLSLEDGSVVLITGGARGITAEVALRLAEVAKPTIVMVGRTPEPVDPEDADTAGIVEPRALKRAVIEKLRRTGRAIAPAEVEEHCRRLVQSREVRENLARVRRAGSRVDYRACDVADEVAFGSLIEAVYRDHGRIDGAIHGAGIIEDRLIRDKKLDSFGRVIGAKVGGAVVLAGKLRPDSLRFLVFFGSVSGRFGNRGQGDYAAASEVLNKLAQDLDRRWPGRVVSINWGPWLQAGMVSPEVLRQFAERGVALISPDVGCRMLVEELRSGRKGEAEILIGGAEGIGDGPSPAPGGEIAATAAAFPLFGDLDRPTFDGGGVQLLRPLDPRRDLYLDDHQLDGRPVLPFAMAMELMAEAASAARPGLEFVAIRNIRLLRGIVVEDPVPTLRIEGVPRAGSGQPGDGPGPSSTLDMKIEGPGGPRRLHYRAAVELGRCPGRGEAGGPAGYVEDPRVAAGAGPMPMSLEEIYREWLFHGPLFRGIVEIESIGPGGARAILRPSSPRDCLRGDAPGDWLIDPVVVDSAFQMQVIWARLHWGMTLLPAGVEGYRGFAPLRGTSGANGDGLIRYELRIRPESQAPLCHCDHFFRDSDGRLLGVLTNVEGTGTKALNRLAVGARR